MDAIAYLEELRARWRAASALEAGPPYFSAEGKRLRRAAIKRRPVERGNPVAGTGKHKYKFPKHFDCDCFYCTSSNTRTKRERDALRFEDKAN